MSYLTFDVTDSSDGILTLEAMASTREAEHGGVMVEVQEVLDWAQAGFGGRQGPVEDGYAWDCEVLVQREQGGWVTVTLTFSATQEFAEAFQAAFFGLDE